MISNPLLKRNRRKLRTFVVLPLFLFQIHVQSKCPSEQDYHPKECVDFFNKKNNIRDREFVGYDLEKQLLIQRCGLDQHPPAIYSYEIADRGEAIVPILLNKLNNDKFKSSYDADKSKYLIVDVLLIMSARGQLKDDSEILIIVRKTVAEIETDWLRKSAERSLAERENKEHKPRR